MKKLISISLIATTLIFGGCANSGLGVGGFGTEVKERFESGTIEASNKVLVSKDMMAVATGAGIGAGVGALAGSRSSGANALKGGIIGAGVGALGGFVTGSLMDNNEKEAFEVEIKANNGTMYKAYLEQELQLNSLVEFVVRDDGKVTNIKLKKVGTPKEVVKEKIVVKEVVKEKIVEKPVYKTKEIVKEKIVEKPVVKEVKVPVLPVEEKKVEEAPKKVEEAPKKVETETRKSIW